MKNSITRRDLLEILARGTLGIGCGAALSRLAVLDALAADAAGADPFKVATVDYAAEPGRKLSRLGFGMMRLPQKGRDVVDEKLADALVDYAIRHGVNYFDTAWMYLGGKSQVYTGKVLSKYDRKKLFIVNKMPGGPWAHDLGQAKDIFKKQLKACRTNYFDNYLLHAVGNYRDYEEIYLKGGILDYLRRERDAGRIRHLGFSFHGGRDDLRRLLDQKDKAGWEVVMLQFSADNVGHDFHRMVAETGLPIVVMEPLHAGRLANLNVAARKALAARKSGLSPAGWALRWVASQKNVAVAISGMSRMSDVVDNCSTFRDFAPLSREDIAAYREIREKYRGKSLLPCTGCAYCAPCPHGVDIPAVFAYVNVCRTEGLLGPNGDGVGMSLKEREKFTEGYHKALRRETDSTHCIGCRICHPRCPQHIQIAREFRRLSEILIPEPVEEDPNAGWFPCN